MAGADSDAPRSAGPPAGGADATVELLDTPEAGHAVVRGGALRTASFAAGLAIAALSAPLIVRHLGKEDYGRLLTVTTLISLVAIITDQTLTNIATREYTSARPEDRRPLLRAVLGLRMLLTVAGVVVVGAFAVLAGYESEMLIGVAVAGAGLLVADYVAGFAVPLAVRLQLGWLAVSDLVRNGVNVALVVVLVLAGAGLVPFYALSGAAALGALAVMAPVVRRDAPWMPARDRARWRALTRDALPVAAATAFGSLYFRVVLLLMSVTATAAETGDFSVSFRLCEIALAVPAIITASAFPVLARAADRDSARLRNALERMAEVGLVLGGAIVVVGVLGAQVAIELVVGDEPIGDSAQALRWQLLALPANFLVAAWSYGLLSLRDHRALLRANASAFVVAVAAALPLIQAFGASGGAVAIVVAEVALAGLLALALRRRGFHLHLRPRTAGVLPAAAIALGVGLGVPLPEPVGAVVGGALYGVLVLWGRVVPAEALDALRRR